MENTLSLISRGAASAHAGLQSIEGACDGAHVPFNVPRRNRTLDRVDRRP